MGIYKPAKVKSSEITEQKVWHQRRKFMLAAAGLGLGAGAGAMGLAPTKSTDKEGLPERLSGIRETDYGESLTPTAYKHITTYNNFYELGTGKRTPSERAGEFQSRPWTLKVSGACEKPGEIGIEDILSDFTQEERVYRFRCVEAWAMVVPWMGVPLAQLLKRFQPTSNAKYVAFETLYDPKRMPGQRRAVLDWPYREGLTIDEAMHPLTLMATGLYGNFLPNQNGAPLRLVVPWKYGFKNIKSIVGIRFVEQEPATTWNMLQPGEYGFYANVNPDVSHPRWSQKRHRVLGAGIFADKEDTALFNGYREEVGHLYSGMDLRKYF